MYRKLICFVVAGLMLAIASGVQAQPVDGQVLVLRWYGGGINDNLDNLKADARFPDSPDEAEMLTALDHPDMTDVDYFACRLLAILTPPADGDYTFWTASDDDSEVWLSTDTDPANATLICNVEGWTNYQDYVGSAGSVGDNQQSAPISLVAGQQYYIEYLFTDGTGGGHGSVGWAGPGIGDEPTMIAGEYLAADEAWIPASVFQAKGPKPADGEEGVVMPLFEWTPGPGAVLHTVYFGDSPDALAMMMPMGAPVYFHPMPLTPGATYYWRIDETTEDGAVYEGNVWSFTVMPVQAWSPTPEDGATQIPVNTTVSWAAGQTAVSYVAYGSKDLAAVEAADPAAMVAELEATSVDLTGLEGFTTYYWRIDTIDTAGAVIAGSVWSFTTIDYLPISEDTVTLDYDNTADPFTTSLTLAAPTDWTKEGLSDLSMVLQGRAGPQGDAVLDEATGTYEVTGAGTDIWESADQFTYAYKTLNGDASMVARVVDLGSGSNEWAKGGVMIRQSLAAGSQHAYMPLTAGGGNGASFQRRIEADGASSNADSAEVVAPPYWVKLDRVGNTFSSSISADGETWTQLGDPLEIAMADPVLIGLAVTSHASGELRTVTFDNVSTTGDVAEGAFTTFSVVNIPFNSAEPVYAAVEDAAGVVGVVTHPDPAATQITSWSPWKIALADFAAQGVDLANVAAVHLGVGDLLNPTAGGTGTVQFDDIRVTLPVIKGTIAWVSFHGADDEPSEGAAGAGFTEAPDKPYTDLLKANGYDVIRYVTTNNPDPAILNAADLVITSRSVASSGYQNDGATRWNSTITAPMIITGGYTTRSSRMGFTTGTDMPDTAGDIKLTVLDPDHPIFAGIALTDGTMDNPFAGVVTYADGTLARGISVNNNPADDEGTVLATVATADDPTFGGMVIGEWPAGATLEHSGGAGTDVLAGPRLIFLTGSREASGISSETAGLYDLYADGAQMFLNAVDYMINPPSDTILVDSLLDNGGFEDGVQAPLNVYGDLTTEVVTELVDAAVPEGVIEGTYCLYVDVAEGIANFWDAGLQPQPIAYEAGKKYTVSVFLKAKSGTVDVNIKPELAADPWTGYSEKMVTVTEEWQEFSTTTDVFEAAPDPAGLTFHIGGAVGGFWVDGIRLYEGDYVAP